MNMDKNVEGLGSLMTITRSVHRARLKISHWPNVASEFEALYYWAETQVDTSGGRNFNDLHMFVKDGYLYCELTLGWLHGREDRILLEVAKEIEGLGVNKKPTIEILPAEEKSPSEE